MEKQPFTPEGVAALLQQLYALPDAELVQESAAVTADFRSWVADHFILSNAQLTFLAGLDNRFVAKAATNTSHFVQNRLPIVLWKENPPETGSLRDGKPRGKIIENTLEEEILDGDPVGFEERACLRFNISYPPIP